MLQGHGGNQHPNANLDCSLDIVWMVYKCLDRPKPTNPPDHIWNRDVEILGLWEAWAKEPGPLLWLVKRPLLASGSSRFGAFLSLLCYILNATAKTSAYGVRDPFSRHLCLALISGILWKKWNTRSCFLSRIQDPDWYIVRGLYEAV